MTAVTNSSRRLQRQCPTRSLRVNRLLLPQQTVVYRSPKIYPLERRPQSLNAANDLIANTLTTRAAIVRAPAFKRDTLNRNTAATILTNSTVGGKRKREIVEDDNGMPMRKRLKTILKL